MEALMIAAVAWLVATRDRARSAGTAVRVRTARYIRAARRTGAAVVTHPSVRRTARGAVAGGTGAAGAVRAGSSAARVAVRRRLADPARRKRHAAWRRTRTGRASVWAGRRIRTGWTWTGDGTVAGIAFVSAARTGWKSGAARGREWFDKHTDDAGKDPGDVPDPAGRPTGNGDGTEPEPVGTGPAGPDPDDTPPRPDTPTVDLTKGPVEMAHTLDDVDTVTGLSAALRKYSEWMEELDSVETELAGMEDLAEDVETTNIAPGDQAQAAVDAVSEKASEARKAISDAIEGLGDLLDAAVKAVEAGIGDE